MKKKKKIKYSKLEEKFYKKHKDQIIAGLKEDVPKNQIKRTFFSGVREEQQVNFLSKQAAMKKVLRGRTFTDAATNYKMYQEDVINKSTKGRVREIKKHLGISRKEKIDPTRWIKTEDGWIYRSNSGKYVLIKRKQDTLDDGNDLEFGEEDEQENTISK